VSGDFQVAQIYLRVSTEEQDLSRQAGLIDEAKASGFYKEAHPERWSGPVRDWTPVTEVWLNPDREQTPAPEIDSRAQAA